MLLLRLWNYIRGYVIILVEGYFLEKFINICIHRQVFLWDIKKQKNATMTLKISINGFKMLKPVARKTNCRIKILRKRGLPFVLNRYKGRKAFAIGAVAFVVLFFLMTSYVWTIEVTGNQKVDTQVVINRLAEMGIKPGVLKYGINTRKAVDNLMIDVGELSWAGVTVKGTKVKVEVVEGVRPPELVSKNVPCDIVASKDGVVKSVVAKTGQQMVKAGDTVKKGQVLISGTIESKNEQVKTITVHAIGSVKARTWYEGRCPVQIKVEEKEKTGIVKDDYSLVLFSKRIDLFHSKIGFVHYDKVEVRKRLAFGEDMVLPFELVIDKYYENNVYEKDIDIEDARKIAADNAYREASADIPAGAEIVKTNTDFIQDENGNAIADVIVECLEEIGNTEIIEVSK